MALARVLANISQIYTKSSASLLRSFHNTAPLNNTKVFVGGLSSDANDKTLTDSFSSYGKIVDVYVISQKKTKDPKGFGFIKFSAIEEAEAAIKEMHGKEIDGRKINVKRATIRAAEKQKKRRTVGSIKKKAS